MGEFAGVFTNADGALFTETYNQLNAYFATVPGNYAQNLRKMYLLNSNYADLSFLFTIHPGEKTNPHLGTEYLAVLETDNATPYYLNLHNGEVAHTLILGMTGSGKSFLCNFLLQNAQKYRPQTYIFDIGGSFQSLTEIFGGSYLNVGQESRDFTINPFSLPADERRTCNFCSRFFRVLIEGDEKRYRLDFKEERKLWDAIERMYVVDAGAAHAFELRRDHRRAQRTAAPLDAGRPVRVSLRQRQRTLSALPASRPSISKDGATPPMCWSRCCFTCSIGRATRLPTRRKLATFKFFCWMRHGCSSKTKPSASTSSRHRRRGASTKPR